MPDHPIVSNFRRYFPRSVSGCAASVLTLLKNRPRVLFNCKMFVEVNNNADFCIVINNGSVSHSAVPR